jgi:hypothetical protein
MKTKSNQQILWNKKNNHEKTLNGIKLILLVCLGFLPILGLPQIWHNIGPDESNQPSLLGFNYEQSIKISAVGIPFILYGDKEGCQVRKYEHGQWTDVGDNVISTDDYQGYLDLELDSHSTPYVIFRENVNSSHYFLSVKKLNGNLWEYVGTGEIALPGEPYYLSLAIDNNDVPYFFCWAYNYSSSSYSLVLMKYINSNWVNIPVPENSGSHIVSIDFDEDNILYISYRISTGYKIMSFDNDEWNEELVVTNPATIISDQNRNIYCLESNGSEITVYNKNNNNWEILGSSFTANVSDPSYYAISLAEINDIIYVAYTDDNIHQARVWYFDDNEWKQLFFVII